ncbi:MAG: response regulator [candidate division NC10 bacterium]|nr:response regulator [candidate division NC10 bacterium]
MVEASEGDQARILVVDDDERARDLLVEVLGRRGHRAHIASDGQTALKLLQEKRPFYDLVITDLNMPVMDGLELLQRIRERSLPVEVILLTSSPGHGMVTRARELEAFAVLSKPCDLEELGRAVESALTRPASRKGPAV